MCRTSTRRRCRISSSTSRIPGFAVPYITEQLSAPNTYFYIASIDGEDVGYVYARVVRRPENAYMHPRN